MKIPTFSYFFYLSYYLTPCKRDGSAKQINVSFIRFDK